MRVIGIGGMGAVFELAPLPGRKLRKLRVARDYGMHIGEIDVLGERQHEPKKLCAANDDELRRAAGMCERLIQAVHCDCPRCLQRRIAREHEIDAAG